MPTRPWTTASLAGDCASTSRSVGSNSARNAAKSFADRLRLISSALDPASVDFALVWDPEPGRLARLPRLRAIFGSGAGVDLIARARLLKLGRSLAVGDVLIFSEGAEAPVARASLTYSIPPQR